MHMSFWWDSKLNNFLFKGLDTKTVPGFIAIWFCVAGMSFIFEFFRYLQAKQRQKELVLRSEQLKLICPTETSTLLANRILTTMRREINITLLDRAFLFGAEITLWFLLQNLGYILMLTVMVYNGWLLIAAVAGGGLGYFVFGQKFMKINLQNCQIIRDTWCMQKCGESENDPGIRTGESTPALEASTSASRSALTCHEVVTASVHVECQT